MSFLKYFEVANDSNLRKIPNDLTSTTTIKIWNLKNVGKPYNRTAWHCLQSFKDLPEIMPNLESISFNNSNITNFEDLTSKMPNLKSVYFGNCHIHNFLGFPSKGFSAQDTIIDSFEGIPSGENCHFSLSNCTIRSLGGGVSLSTLQAIIINFLSQNYEYYSKEDIQRLKNIDRLPEFDFKITRPDNSHNGINLDIPPNARKLLYESIDFQIERAYSPKFNRLWPMPSSDPDNAQYSDRDHDLNRSYEDDEWIEWLAANVIHPDEWHFTDEYNNPTYTPSKERWIHGFRLQNKLFIPENLDRLHKYYSKTTLQLAQEYISDPTSLSPELIERLIHEIDPELRKMLENNLPPDNPVIKQISAKFAFKTQNGLKIFK